MNSAEENQKPADLMEKGDAIREGIFITSGMLKLIKASLERLKKHAQQDQGGPTTYDIIAMLAPLADQGYFELFVSKPGSNCVTPLIRRPCAGASHSTIVEDLFWNFREDREELDIRIEPTAWGECLDRHGWPEVRSQIRTLKYKTPPVAIKRLNKRAKEFIAKEQKSGHRAKAVAMQAVRNALLLNDKRLDRVELANTLVRLNGNDIWLYFTHPVRGVVPLFVWDPDEDELETVIRHIENSEYLIIVWEKSGEQEP